MTRLACLVLVTALATSSARGPVVTPQNSPADWQASHVAWVMERLKAMQTIKAGMTRADLLRVFTVEGGLSNRRQRTYVDRACPYFKVNVEFEAVGAAENLLDELGADVITKISPPYLQWSVTN